ncbi:MAG: efflux RND transporter permease subunit [Deltaproteobacteria bacterium]|nr:efflux RND transporter permease subunit [Deltaproteobacteria bacterium]
MALADVSIRRPVLAWMMMAAIVLFGAISFARLGVSELPDVDFPIVNVSLTLEGAAPEIIESDVVDVVEDVLTTIEGVREISSSAREGSADVTVEFELDRDIDLALQDVQSKLAQAQRRLPRELDPPVITKTNPEDFPIIWLGLGGTRTPGELADYARYDIRPRIQTLPGVAEVMFGGLRDRNLRIWVDKGKLEANQITVPDVLAALAREHIELPAGRIETATRERNVRTESEALTPEEIANIVIANRDGRLTRLSDVAGVEFGLEDKRRIARVNGLPAVGLGVKKQRGANAVEVGKRVKAEMAKIQQTLPDDLELGINYDGTTFVEESTKEIEFAIVLAVALTGIVCWAFLGSWSATLNVLLAIPVSLLGVFTAFYFLGFTLNTFTLLGLSLAVGIVVDDAIMVLENIFRHHEMGKDKVRAAADGAREISFAALAATLAVIVIFLPVAFMKGIMGKFFFQFGVTLSLALALSLFEALSLTPMRSSQFMGNPGHDTRMGRLMDRLFGALSRGYRRLLGGSLRHPWLVLASSIAVFALSLFLVGGLKKEFVPPQDQSRLFVRYKTPVGSSIDFTDERLKRVEQLLAKHPEITRYFLSVGGFGGEVNTAVNFITLSPREQRSMSAQDFMGVLRKELNAIPDLTAIVQDPSLQSFSARRGSPVEFSIRGPSLDVLAQKQDEIMEKMREAGVFTDIDSDYLVGMPEIRVIPDRDRAADLGVSMEQIGETVQALVGGIRMGKFKQNGPRYDMRLRLVTDQRLSPKDISDLYLRSSSGSLVRLDQVVRIEQHPTLLTIHRLGRERSISMFSNLTPAASQEAALEQVEAIGREVLPPGYKLVVSGSAQTFRESFQSLGFAMLLGVVIAYMVLASQFNSYLHPVTILLALPFSITGALISLYLAGHSLNIYSVIGLILLMGIVKKNSILLVDYTNQRRADGATVEDALLTACPTRLRPILMTSIATVAAAVPPALALGPGAEVRAPMAVSVIGGVVVSTLLTLVVVPCFYLVTERIKARLFPGAAEATAASPPPPGLHQT